MYSINKDNQTVHYRDDVEQVGADIPLKNFAGLFEAEYPPIREGKAWHAEAVLNPVKGGKRLSQIAREKNAKTAVIIVSDVTRAVPTATVAPTIVDELLRGGVPLEGIRFMVALGVHRDSTDEENRVYVGEELYAKIPVINHNPYDPETLVDLGFTSQGTPFLASKQAYECDLHITVGKVELHEMAGFSGGRKSILPGVSSEKTILHNHRPEMIFAKGAVAGNMEGNPIHEDMLEAAQRFGVDFSVNIVVDINQEPSAIFAGDLVDAHVEAANYVLKYSKVVLPEKPDVIVTTSGTPLNIEMYQAVKALIALGHIAQPGMAVVFYGEFPEGVHSPDFMEPFYKYEDLDEARQFTLDDYRVQRDHTLPIIDLLKLGLKVFVFSPNVTREEIAALRMVYCESLQDAVDQALAYAGTDAKLIVLPKSQRAIFSIAG